MSINIYIILISIFNLYLNIPITNIEVNGGNYGNSFIFYISGTAEESISKSITVPIIILIDDEEKEVKCSVEDTVSGSLAFYSCKYNKNIESNVFLKKELDNHLDDTGNIEIKPLNLNIKYLETFNLEFIDLIWEYTLKGELYEGIQIKEGSLSYMNINVNNTNKKAGCLLFSRNENQVLFNCKIINNNQNISDKIIIPKNQNDGTITFNPELGIDMNITIYREIPFVEAKKLYFNEEKNKWEFLIIIPYQLIPVSTKSIVDILYKQELSSATFYSNDYSMLECEADKNDQAQTDLVKIHSRKSEYSTIKWSNLTNSYTIPIEKELTYLNSYDLVYTSTKIWSFIIKFSKENIFPSEEAIVTLDIKINDVPSIARCYYINPHLSCKTIKVEEDESLSLKISYEKNDGSIKWKNILNRDVPITISSQISYEDSYDLQFKNNSWYFVLKATKSNDKISKFPFSLKIGYIREEEEKNEGIAYCYPIENNIDLYNCEVYYEEQSDNDLILLSSSTESTSVIWNTEFEDKNIVLSTSLNYIKAFDLKYLNEKWIFNIEIENNISNGSKVKADIIFNENDEDTATCFFNTNNKILSLSRDSAT